MSRLEEKIAFECDFCSNCKDRKECKVVCDSSKCPNLFDALKKEGFIVKGRLEQEKKRDTLMEATDLAMNLSFEDKMQICVCCEHYNICGDLHNSKCPILIKKLEESLKEIYEKEVKEKVKEKVIQFPVDMDEMQRNILISLLNVRKEAREQSILTANGFVAVIDALFYLVKGMPVIYYDSENLKKYFGKVPERVKDNEKNK